MAMQFIRIGGKRIHPLPLMSILQTDGSFSRTSKQVAFILRDNTGDQIIAQRLPAPDVKSSTEAEWMSIAAGLEAAIEQSQESIGIENDCLSVVSALMQQHYVPRREYQRHWHKQIRLLAAKTDWTGIRWIPRKLNLADNLFR